MNQKVKLDLIIQSITKERAKNPENTFISINPAAKDHHDLQKIPFDEIQVILEELSTKLAILRIDEIKYRPRRKNESHYDFLHAAGSSLPIGFIIELQEDFEPWHKAYLKSKNISLPELSLKFLKATLAFLKRIQDDVAVNSSHILILDADILNHTQENSILGFLHSKDVILSYEYNKLKYGLSIKIKVNVDRFDVFKRELTDYLSQVKNQKSGGNSSKPVKTAGPKFPPITKWEDVAFKFVDGNNVKIKIGDKEYVAHYKEMGFEDKRTRNPNAQWSLLEYLAQHNGQISWDSSQANDTVKKKKQRLSKTLQKFFNFPEDPFHPYKSEDAYTIKIIFQA
ncbi:MAG: hypothetical protein HQL24_10000 [Candidatus Omnitrophica bacterium]|nr:hypothetical protein [Candidatus Omnitrophota bacterium]